MNQNRLNIPEPIINRKEAALLDVLTERYNKLIEPSKVACIAKTAGTKVVEIVPEKVKTLGSDISSSITLGKIYKQAMELVWTGFKVVEEQAAKFSVSENLIIKKVDKVTPDNTILEFDDICFARSYNISKLVSSYKTQDIFLAFGEGGATGVFGFWGLPFNLVLSTFLFFRAVQSIAMYYGFDVKNNVDELIISSEVFTRALSPAQNDVNNELTAVISKVMLMSQAAVVKQTAQKTWTDMATKGGVPLLITQMRALAHKAAEKALANAGAKELEHSLFKEVFEQIGRKLTLKTVQRAVPVVSAAICAFTNAAQIRKVLDYADIFYQKRFILEKVNRVTTIIDCNGIIDVDEPLCSAEV
ncbi:MAG: EcsC family protein [Oscillospiraceae bacterium]|nr:EcsC family protein [Oscillospiraceae bacterium]